MVTLAVQAAGIAIIATGMVMVIVSRNIDLSVGSLVGLIAMTYALLMTDWLPRCSASAPTSRSAGRIALALGIGLGALDRRAPGIHHRLRRRALVHRHPRRAAVDPRASCGTCPAARPCPASTRHSSSSAAAHRARSAARSRGCSAIIGCVAIIALLVNGRRQRRRYGFPLRPMWAEVLIGVVGLRGGPRAWPRSPTPTCGRRAWRTGSRSSRTGARRPRAAGRSRAGFPYPIVLLIGVTLVMTWLATRRRFGRYVYAYGGNPDAAELARHQHPLDDPQDVRR